jgi:glucose-1-phosphate thymidylyltransferase
MEMKALVLSGGMGTRLRPLTYSQPKQLIPVGNVPVLHRVIDQIEKTGISEIGVVVSPETGKLVEQSLHDRSGRSSITIIWQNRPGGLAHAVKTAQDFLGDTSFIMALGDNMIGGAFTDLVQQFKSQNSAAAILLKKVDDPSGFGVAVIDDESRVAKTVEKPQEPVSDLAITGIYCFSPAIHHAISRISPSARGELEITDAIQELVDLGSEVTSLVTDKWWLDTGTVDDLLEANLRTLNEMTAEGSTASATVQLDPSGALLLPGATLSSCTVIPPVIIGEGATVIDSEIGPNVSVGDHSNITNSKLENTVLMDESDVVNASVSRSIIGKRSKISGGLDSVDTTLDMVTADDTTITLR